MVTDPGLNSEYFYINGAGLYRIPGLPGLLCLGLTLLISSAALALFDLFQDIDKVNAELLLRVFDLDRNGTVGIVNGIKQAIACVITDRFTVHMSFPPIKLLIVSLAVVMLFRIHRDLLFSALRPLGVDGGLVWMR